MDFTRAVARFWFDLPDLGDMAPGPALSRALLAEEARHGVTRDVAWAYAEAMPSLLGRDPMVNLLPLAFSRGALRAVALETPVDLDGLYHVQTRSPEVCREMGSRVPSFSVRDEACLRALIEHGTAVRKVVADCAPFEIAAPFEITFFRNSPDAVTHRWFRSYLAAHLMPIARLDLDVWLCWDRDFDRACVVKGHDQIIAGRWGPRDVMPEPQPPPWAEPEARTIGGERWAATMCDDHRRGGSAIVADPARGWCLLHADVDERYRMALCSAWLEGRALQGVSTEASQWATLAELRIEGTTAYFAWLGHRRVLRLRRDALDQLTTDHDLRYLARIGELPMPDEMLPQLAGFRTITTRALPKDSPETGSCDVEPDDRFVLIDDGSQQLLEHAAGGRDAFIARLRHGDARVVARWMRHALEHTETERPVVVIDADAVITSRASTAEPTSEPTSTASPDARDLIERPAAFHGRTVRFRAVYRRSVEVSVIADAWFSGECALPFGTWIVDAEGTWLHDGTRRGHMAGYASELRGTLRAADLSRVRPIEGDRIRFARRYVPLSAEIVVDRGLLEWVHDGQLVTRLGRDGRLPLVAQPERCRMKATFVVGAYGHLGLLDWEILASEPLAPTPATAASPGPRGRYVTIEGFLTPTDRLPVLDGVLSIVPPSHTRSARRHEIPSADEVARYREVLGRGRIVEVRGEVVARDHLLALAIEGYDGAIDL
jgi:hypothetical protein